MDLNQQTIKLIREYAKTLVNAGVIKKGEFSEALLRLKNSESRYKLTSVKEERLISKKECARLLGYKSPRTIDRLEKNGLIERTKNSFGHVRYRISEVQRIIGI